MLEKYENSQKVAYKIMTNSVFKNRQSHAYLIESKDNSEGIDIVLAFAKFLLCPYNKTSNSDCVKCTQCQRIDDDCFSDIYILRAEGLQIKKEQIENLQQKFTTKPVEAKYKIYIIEQSEKLNDSSSASLLKFLEEPESNVIALLLTSNKSLLLDTISSRCQQISLIPNVHCKNELIEKLSDLLFLHGTQKKDFILNEENSLKIEAIKKFILELDNKGISILPFINKLWGQYFKTKEDYIYAFNVLILLYKDKIESVINAGNNEEIELSKLCKKLEIIISYKESIKYNLNLQLLLDKFIMDVEAVK